MYPYIFYPVGGSRQTPKLISDIEKAINGEYSAIQCYEKLAGLAQSDQDREQILEIRNDEIKHYGQFVAIYRQLTGKQTSPKISEQCPDIWQEGLLFAFRDEQETVDFYLDISDSTHDLNIKEVFRRAAADEQNHAVWFSFYYFNTKG